MEKRIGIAHQKSLLAEHQEYKNSMGMFEKKSRVRLSSYLTKELCPALVLQVITFFVSNVVIGLLELGNDIKVSSAWCLSFLAFTLWYVILIGKLLNSLTDSKSDPKSDSKSDSERSKILVKAWEYENFRRLIFSLVISILASAVFIYFSYFQLNLFNIYVTESLLLIGLLIGNIILQLLNYELSSYIFFGLMTAVVSLLSFSIVDKLILYLAIGNKDWNWLISQTVSFVLAVLFAYLTNSKYVFKSSSNFWKELREFFVSRLLSTLIFEYLGIFVFINLLNLNRDFSKLLAAVLVTLANYVLSKFWVFRSK